MKIEIKINEQKLWFDTEEYFKLKEFKEKKMKKATIQFFSTFEELKADRRQL